MKYKLIKFLIELYLELFVAIAGQDCNQSGQHQYHLKCNPQTTALL